jgi:hypothetical protein
MIVLAVGAGAASWSTSHALAMVEPGVELALRWRMALAFANWFVRLEPWLAIFGVGAAALVGAAVSRGTTIPQERRLLLGWLLIAFVSLVFDVLFLATWTTLTNPWISMLALSAGFGVVALVASVVVAGHLQSRLRASGSRINGWHVIAASAVLVLLGPAALVPPIAVWLYSGRLLGPVRGSPS